MLWVPESPRESIHPVDLGWGIHMNGSVARCHHSAQLKQVMRCFSRAPWQRHSNKTGWSVFKSAGKFRQDCFSRVRLWLSFDILFSLFIPFQKDYIYVFQHEEKGETMCLHTQPHACTWYLNDVRAYAASCAHGTLHLSLNSTFGKHLGIELTR